MNYRKIGEYEMKTYCKYKTPGGPLQAVSKPSSRRRHWDK